MDGFCAYGVGFCYDKFVVLVIACYYLLTQGAYLELCPYLLGHFLGFLLGVCNRGFLLLDQSLGGADLFFEFHQLFLQEMSRLVLASRVAFFWLSILHF